MNTPRQETGTGKVQDQSQRASSFNPHFVARLEAAMSWDTAAKNVQQKMGITEEKPYRGITEAETNLTQRIAKATFQPENSNEYRVQQRVEDVLKEQARQLKEDLARARKYEKDLKEALAQEAYLR